MSGVHAAGRATTPRARPTTWLAWLAAVLGVLLLLYATLLVALFAEGNIEASPYVEIMPAAGGGPPTRVRGTRWQYSYVLVTEPWLGWVNPCYRALVDPAVRVGEWCSRHALRSDDPLAPLCAGALAQLGLRHGSWRIEVEPGVTADSCSVQVFCGSAVDTYHFTLPDQLVAPMHP